MPRREFVRDAVGAVSFAWRGAGDDTSHAVRDRVLGAVRGVHHDDLVALNADIVPKLLARVRPEARRLVDLHRHAGRATYIVSASPVELVEPLAVVYTGQLAGPFCYGAGKVEAMGELARWEGLDLGQCWAYSDSASDLPMLNAVGHPVAVNPDGKMERAAHANAWPIVVFRKRSKAVVRRTTQAVGTAGVAAGGFAAGLRYARSR